MSDIAIKVENLSKRYRIGLKDELVVASVAARYQKLKILALCADNEYVTDKAELCLSC